eukprot:SAG22_NODE_4259_length_1325_cov_1.408646_2_plen_123_part_00
MLPVCLSVLLEDAYDHVGSLHYGPYLLVGLTDGAYALDANVADIDSWLTLDPASSPGAAHELSFTATAERGGGGGSGGGFKLLPLNRVVDQMYTAHFNISAGAVQVRQGVDLPELPQQRWKA